jgi:predicted transcriptional regulator
MENQLSIEIYKSLKEKYQNKEVLTKKELSSELGVSVSSINYYIQRGEGLPSYIKFGGGDKGRVLFPIVNVVEYLSDTVLVS